MKVFKILAAIICLSGAIYAKTISLDAGGSIHVNLQNNKMNLLKFPFIIQSAQLSTETPESFQVTSKNMSLIILPTTLEPDETADVVLFSLTGEPYLLKITATGDEQQFVFTSNKVINESPTREAKQFETNRIERDITNIMKKAAAGEPIPGYTKVEVKKQFLTPDLEMQKEFFYDGGKYRVETWFLKNTTNQLLTLDFTNFYTDGVLAMSFEVNKLEPGQVGKMWMIINKSTIADRLNLNQK